MKKLLMPVLILYLICGGSANGQPWMKGSQLKSSKEPNFYDIQKSFNEYWKGRPIERSKGYNPFKRWEYFMEPRVYPSGVFPNTIMWDEIKKKESAEKSEIAATANWTHLGPDDTPRFYNNNSRIGGSGRINCVAFHPFDSSIMYVGAPSGGFWKTTDGGQTWVTSTDQLAAIGISDIAVIPQSPNVIYLATGDGDGLDTYSIGILKSTNGGVSWKPTIISEDVTVNNHFRRIIVHPVDPDIMIAASAKGIYKTTDGWDTYSLVKSGHFKDLEFNTSDPSIIYAASYDYSGNAKIYKSTDTGNTFNEAMTGIELNGEVDRIELAVTKANSSYVYALCSKATDGGFYGLYRSVNGAQSWSLIYSGNYLNLLGWEDDGQDLGGQGWYDLTLAVSPDKATEVFVGGVNIWWSLSGGGGWKPITMWYHGHEAEYVHADHHMLVFNPYTNVLFSGNDGGIYKSYDKGVTWTDISDGLHILQIYRITNSVNDPDLNITGNQDNGTILRDASDWYEIYGGDGMECLIDYNDDDLIYASMQRGSLLKSTNGGKNFTSIKPDVGDDGAWITPFIMHPVIPNILYSGYKDVYKSVNGGYSWTKISDNLTGGVNMNALAVAGSNDDHIYASARDKIWKTNDGGETWTDISEGISDHYITCIAVSETDPNKVWITLSGYEAGEKVYYSGNGGQSWSNYSEGLPNVPANCIIYENGSNSALYAGTDIGVYYRDRSMSQWVDYSDNLPNVIVNDLAIHYTAGKLRAGTYGRGLWESDLYPQTAATYADYTVQNPEICIDASTKFTYAGSADIDSVTWNFGSGASPSSAKTTGPHTVSYNATGRKTIELKVYKDGVEYNNVKTDILNVVSELDFDVYPEMTALCAGGEVHLYAGGNHNFTWAPATGLNTTSGDHVIANPSQKTTYVVTATSGSCIAERSVSVLLSSNDNVCDAITLNEGANGYFTNICATAEENEPVPPKGSTGLYGCESQDGWCEGETTIDNSVWFKFIAPDDDIVSISTSGFDNQIAVYKAETCNDLLTDNYELIAANDDFPGMPDYAACIQEMTDLVPGETYWLQLDGSYGGVEGICSISINNYRLSSYGEELPEHRDARIDIYPNPNNGIFTVSYAVQNLSEVTIKIYNIQGKEMIEKKVRPTELENETIINAGALPKGIYILQLIDRDNYMYNKFIVN